MSWCPRNGRAFRAVTRSPLLVCALISALGTWASAECIEETPPHETTALFSKHLSKTCSEGEREARAVSAQELLEALKAGKGITLMRVVVEGNLRLDSLPQISAQDAARLSPGWEDGTSIARQDLLRVVSGPITIRDSRVRGELATHLKEGFLLVAGPVSMTGTIFEQDVDFSRTVFLSPVDFSEAVFLKGAFFVHARFSQNAQFEKVAFGDRARFHKARFKEPVTFLRAGFNGMAEFLEVTFEKEATFSRAYFKLGTGFSGSRFGGVLDFSEALFEREAFFPYTIFEQDAYFRRTTFRNQADFSQAEFRGLDDFSKTFFEKKPRFTGTKVSGPRSSPGGLQDPVFVYGLAGAVVLFSIIFVWVLRKG